MMRNNYRVNARGERADGSTGRGAKTQIGNRTQRYNDIRRALGLSSK